MAPLPPGKRVDIGGYQLHVHETGKGPGPVVVLITGAGDFSFDWALVQPSVAEFARVCSYDRAGFAWSDPGPEPRTMRHEAFELHALLVKTGMPAPYVLVGHSVGGLIARLFHEMYPAEVAGIVLVDPTTEHEKLSVKGKLVRMRDLASDRPVPQFQTITSGAPPMQLPVSPATADASRPKAVPRTLRAPFNRLPADAQAARRWALGLPKPKGGFDYFAEELQVMHVARTAEPRPLGDKPLVVLVSGRVDAPPDGLTAEEWSQVRREKIEQKSSLASLSSHGRFIVVDSSGHHIQIDEPAIVIGAIREVVAAAR